jgi:hypothetical protein
MIGRPALRYRAAGRSCWLAHRGEAPGDGDYVPAARSGLSVSFTVPVSLAVGLSPPRVPGNSGGQFVPDGRIAQSSPVQHRGCGP